MINDCKNLSNENLRELIFSYCSEIYQNSAFIIANVMADLFNQGASCGDMHLESLMRQMIQDGAIVSDNEREEYGFYSVARCNSLI